MTRGNVRRLGAGALLLACLVALPGQASADDPAFSVAAGSGAEGESVSFTVTFAEPVPESGYTLSYSVTHGSSSGADFGATSGNLGVAAEATTATITLPLADDALDEFNETFTLNVSKDASGTDTAAGTITGGGDPQPAAQIGDATVTEGNSGTVEASFPVTLSVPSGKPVTVHYSTGDGTAVQPADYQQALNQTITIAPGGTTGTITVNVKGDTSPEGNEHFFVNLTTVDNGSLGADTQGRGTIADDDVAPSASINDVTVTEVDAPNTVTASFTVTLSSPAPGPVQVRYSTFDGSATQPADYTQVVNGTVNIAAGASSGQANVVVKGDGIAEGSETFVVDLISATGTTISSDSRGIATITDDDVAPSASIDDVTVTEVNAPNTVTASFTVTLSSPAPGPVQVRYSTFDGSAVQPADYTQVVNGTVNIAAGASSGQANVVVKGDGIAEGSETFVVDLISATGATISSDSRGVGTIVDNDAAPTISVTDVQVTEGSGTTVNLDFKVRLSASSAQRVEVTALTQNGTALSASDYEFKSLRIVWVENTPAAELEKTFRVLVTGDVLDEKTETLTVRLESALNATISATQGQAVGRILDNDATALLSAADAEGPEGSGGTSSTMNFKVTLSTVSDRPVTVSYSTANGTAAAGSDYAAASGQVTFAEGEVEKSVPITILGDDVTEENETVLLNLSGPIGANFAAGGAQGQGTIVDKNAKPSLSISDTTAREGEGATFTVSLAGTTLQEVRVGFSTSDGLARAGADYVARVGTLTFAPGEKTKSIAVTVLDDGVSESVEDFTVSIGDPVNATITKSRGIASIEASDQVVNPNPSPSPNPGPSPGPGPTTNQPVAKPATVLVPRMILGPRTVSIGVNGIAKMLVNCQKVSQIACAGTVELERAVKPVLKLGKKTFTVKKGAKGYASIKLTPRALAILRKNGTLRAKVFVLVKTSAKPLKITPGIITLKGTKALRTSKPKPPPKPKEPTTKVIVDP